MEESFFPLTTLSEAQRALPPRSMIRHWQAILVANHLQMVTKEVVETSRQNLIIGPD